MAQRHAALKRANEIRVHRARLKAQVKAGETPAEQLLDDPLCETMKVFDLLLAVPTLGRVKVNRLLIRLRISPSKTLGGLSERQRGELLPELRR